jgi:hypothetical protein
MPKESCRSRRPDQHRLRRASPISLSHGHRRGFVCLSD